MKLSRQEKAARWAAFQEMKPAEKIDHVFTYYKWQILLMLIVLAILGSSLQRTLNRKEPVLYLALSNVSVGEEMENVLLDGFLSASGMDGTKQEVYAYRNLYFSDNAETVHHEYAYASQMKIMGTIQAKKLDAVIMNHEAYDLFSSRGYLADLTELLSYTDPVLCERVKDRIISNKVILKDNAIEWQLGEAETHEVITESKDNGIELTDLPKFCKAGFSDRIYFGIIANSPRIPETIQYLSYLIGGKEYPELS